MPGEAWGRPLRQIRETLRRPGWYGCEDLIAWLLRVSRRYGRNKQLANMTHFAAAFQGGCWPRPVSVSQVSRWETAAVRAGYLVLRRYEELLGLAPNQLVAVADWVYRTASGSAGPPVLSRGLDPADPHVYDRSGQLLELALSGDLMTGADWAELTAHLGVSPMTFLYPATAWRDLAERLISELLIADGLAWLTRSEALRRLMGHPRGLQAVVGACGALIGDSANQVVIEPLTILDLTAHHDANRHVLAQLANPAGERALRGALLASVEKIPRRHFRPTQLGELADVAAELLDVPDLGTAARQLAAEVLRSASPGQLDRARSNRLRRATDPVARSILANGQTAAPDISQHVTARILSTASADLPESPYGETDPILARLTGQLLFSPNQNQRILAGLLIAATPYRDAVGAGLAVELASWRAPGTVPWINATLAALPFLGRPADRVNVEHLILGPGLPSAVTDTAAWTIGHIPGESDRRFWLSAIQIHRHVWERNHGASSISTLQGLTYALGVNHNHGLLAAIQADTRLPAPIRAAAAWWLSIPARTIASVLAT